MQKMAIICLCTINIVAQATAKDTLRMDEDLSDKKDIRLRPEVIEAIKSGTLIRLSENDMENKLMNAPAVLPLSKEFKSYFLDADTVRRKIDYTKLPPNVFMLYFNEPVEEIKLQSFSLVGIENYKDDRPADPPLITDPTLKFPFIMINLNNVIQFYGSKQK